MELSEQIRFIIHLHTGQDRVEVEMPFITTKNQNPTMIVEIDPLLLQQLLLFTGFSSPSHIFGGKETNRARKEGR